MFQPGANIYTQGFGSRPENVEVPHIDVRAPTTTDILYPIGKTWLNKVAGNYYVLANFTTSNGVTTANWAFLGSSTGDLNSLTTQDLTVVTPTAGTIVFNGVANQLTTTGSNSPGTVNVGLVNAVIAPGSLTTTTTLAATTTVTAGTGITSTTGNIVASAGNINATLGSMSAGTTVTAGTGITSTTGNIVATAGNISATLGSVSAGTTVTATLGAITATNGNVVLGTAGNKIVVATGSNASVGTSSAMAGTPGAVIVATTACSATAKIFYSRATTGGTPGQVSITAQDGTGFTLTSTGNESSTFNWWIINT